MPQNDPDALLATLIHISDTHFGSQFTTEEGTWKKLTTLRGLQVHSYQVARSLAIRVKQIFSDREDIRIPVCVVFTGDLTSSGKEDEFLVGSTFLRGEHWLGAGDKVGLGLGPICTAMSVDSPPTLFSIPGNHDIWQRNNPKVMDIYKDNFPFSYPNVLEIKTTKCPIVIYGLDSTLNTKLRHRFARGRVPPGQLESLEKKLQDGLRNKVIQVVCVHHPLIDPEGKSSKLTMQLDKRGIIARRLLEAGAHLVLSGHLHEYSTAQAKPGVLPAHVIIGTATQQFEKRSFCVFDVYQSRIEGTVFHFDPTVCQFKPDLSAKQVFPVS